MTDKPITQADLDAFRGEIVEALKLAEAVAYNASLGGSDKYAAKDALHKAADRLANPPKLKPELPTMEDWKEFHKHWNGSDGLANLAAAIVRGEVELPRYKEGR